MKQQEGRTQPFKSDNQNFFQLASIQSASVGFLGIIIGQQLAKQFGPGIAICSIALGNLILWLIAIAIISMVDRAQSNAIDNFKSYIGKFGGILVALILMVAFLNWYALEINFSLAELNSLFQSKALWQKGALIRYGAALGLFTALLSIGGIRLLKWITVISFPLLFLYTCYSIFTSGYSMQVKGAWGLSFSAVVTSLLTELPGVINFPTFFRHSRSRAHSYLALTVLTIFITFFQVSTIWMRFSLPGGSELTSSLVLLSAFIILILNCCNLLNIYLASACWEAIVPHFGGAKGYAIIGLLGTLMYTFVQISSPVLFLEDLTNCYIGNLGVVLLMAFLIRIIVRHRPRSFEQLISLVTWLFGCVVATIYESQHFLQGVDALLAGVNASVLFFLCVIFIEETLWAVRQKMGGKLLGGKTR